MPTPSEFEEKEFEIPLFRELLGSGVEIWTPGQVLEGHLGFDGALAVTTDYWKIVGRMETPGVKLGRYGLSPIFARPGDLPDFSTNLFLQVKRPWEYKAPPAELTAQGLAAPCWYFEITPHQQEFLEQLALHLGPNAEVAYACAAFAQKRRLFSLQVEKVLRHHTTFPTAAVLKGHSRWAYAKGGASGVGYSDPEKIDEPPLAERLDRIRPARSAQISERWIEHEYEAATVPAEREALVTKNLVPVSVALDKVLEQLDQNAAPGARDVREALDHLADDRREYQRLALRIAAISAVAGMTWLVVGPRKDPA